MVALNKVGGNIMFFSLLLPAILLIIGPIMFFIWMFGLAIVIKGPYSDFGFIIDIVGITIFIILLIFSFICMAKEPGKTKTLGILSIIFLLIYFAWWFFIGINIASAIADFGGSINVFVLPFIGFFGILIGAILNIAAKG